MKTQQILDKYRKIISGILKCNPEEILFYVSQRGTIGSKDFNTKDQIGELKYIKSNDWGLGFYEVYQGTNRISTFRLYELHPRCAFMVVEEDFRNKRIGTVLNNLRQDVGRLLGYSAILCTDIDRNIHQRKLLATNGWKDVHTLINKRTGNRIYLSVIDI